MIVPYYINPYLSPSNTQFTPLSKENNLPPPLFYFEGRRLEKYEDLIANLSEPQRINLEEKMTRISDQQVEIAADAIHRGVLSDPVFKDNAFPLSALLALKKGLIDGLTFSTSQLFGNAINWRKPWEETEIIPLFAGDAINDQAWRLIKETCQPFTGTQFSHEFKNEEEEEEPYLNDDQLNTFFELAKKLPPIDRQFLLYPETNPIRREGTSKTTVSVIINAQVGFNALSRISDSEREIPLRMIPSKGITQALIIAKWGDLAPTLISRFLISPSSVLDNQIPANEREFCLNFAYLPLVTKADSWDCDLKMNEVELHDGYHGYIFGSIPLASRIKFSDSARIFKNRIEAYEKFDDRFAFRCAYESLVDMEHGVYSHYKKEEIKKLEDQIFWTSIGISLNKAQTTYFLTYPKSNKIEGKQIKKLFQEKVVKDFFKDIINKADDYKEKGIILDYLLSPKIKLIDPGYKDEVMPLSKQAKKILASRFKGKSNDELVRLSKNKESYLLRKGAAKAQKKKKG